MAKTINYTKILQDEASFQLVRTNPKLTGNVKLTIDGNDKMWFNSIAVNDELSKSAYQKMAIDPTQSLPSNMFRFFNLGSTPNEIVYDLTENVNLEATSSDFKDQYDFSKYFSGVKYLTSRQYDEKLSYFAPIFLKKDIPDFFVIFKINDPLNHPIDEMVSSYPYNREEYIIDLFKKSTLIKTFDLRETSVVGKYIRDYVNDPAFPSTPLEVSYDEESLTNFNGILYDSGIFGSRGELLYDFYRSSNPLKFFEEYMTLGFERNGVIFPNILNLEFIFDDDTSEIYDFNRYIGVYVNNIELSKLDIDLNRIYNSRGDWENTPAFRKEYFEYEDIYIEQSNNNGVIIPVKNSDVYFSDFVDIFSDKNNMFFNTLMDLNSNIHTLNLNDAYDIDYENGIELNSGILRMSDTNIKLGDFFGPDRLFIQDKGELTFARGYSHIYIKINSDLSHLDNIKFYHPQGTLRDSNGRYEILYATVDYEKIPNPGDYYVYNDVDNIVGHDKFYFNATGFKKEIASAIAGCINGIRNVGVKAYAINDYVFVKNTVAHDNDYLYKMEFTSPSNDYSVIDIDSTKGSDLIDTLVEFKGGSRESGNRIIIDAKHVSKINEKFDDILIKTVYGWSKIEKISKNIDVINEDVLIDQESKDIAIDEFFGKAIVTLALDHEPKIESGDFTIRLKYRPIFGMLSFFPIKDFDFDFYSSEYLNFPAIDLYKHYYIPPESTLLAPGRVYKVYGNGSIRVVYDDQDDIIYNSGESFQIDPESTSNVHYVVHTGDPMVSFEMLDKETIGSDLWTEVNDENGEYNIFPGFFILKDPDRVIEESDSDEYQLRDKYLNGISDNEYNFYKENSCKDFALKSKIIPYITKWVIPDGLDARSNYYRLNNELVFGFNNFTPDHEDTSQNPTNFTHEWFYIESKFNFVDSRDTIISNNSYFEEPFDLDRALTEDGYFIDYFTYTPTFSGEEIGKTQTRYSPIIKNSLGIYETFFKGFKLTFKDYIDANNLDQSGKPEFDPKSNRFEDYKFTCILKTVDEDINNENVPPIRYRFIEHKDFKFIMLLIELNIGSKLSIHEIFSSIQGSSPFEQYNTVYNKITSSPDGINFLDDSINGSSAFNLIDGDYRVNFNLVNDVKISDMTYTTLYSLKHKKYNNLLNNFSNVKLSFKFALNKFVDNVLESISIDNISNYPSNLKDEITKISSDKFIILYDKYFNIDRFIDSVSGLNPLNSSPISVVNNKSIICNDSIGIISSNNTLYQYIPSSISNSYVNIYFSFKIFGGGESYFESLFEKLSFAKFKEFVNKLDKFIEYHSYSLDDSALVKEESNIYCEIPDRSIIEKVDAIIPVIDSDKPTQLAFDSIIGFNYERAELDNTYELSRYPGGFSPLFKDIFTFNSKFSFNKNDITTLDSSNVRFNINIPDFLNLTNFSHIKVAKTKILSLESDKEYDPLYEIPGEIAIGRSNYDLLLSNWDHGFHYIYSDKNKKYPVPGTLRIEEDDCFTSKVLKLRDELELNQFSVNKVRRLDKINLDNYEIVYEEKNDSIHGYINVKNVMTSNILADGISRKFEEYLNASTIYIGNYKSIEDYVKDYIDINITKLYEILSIEFYTKFDKELLEDSNNSNLNPIEFRILDDAGRIDGEYKLNKNIKINKIDRFTLKFEISKSLNSGTLISPKIKIKFI